MITKSLLFYIETRCMRYFSPILLSLCFFLIDCNSGAPDEPSVDTDDEPPVKVKEEPSPEELARMDSIQRVEDSLYQAEQLAIYRAAELERMEGFIADYYVALENRGYFQAHNWYADEVDQWINKKDLTPDKINEKWNDVADSDHTNQRFRIRFNTLAFDRAENGNEYYTFDVDFSCYRPSRFQQQTCNILIEMGVNEDKKLVSYIEKKITNLRFRDF